MPNAKELDAFGDGSCLELVTLDGNVDTFNNGSLTIVGDPAVYVPGKYGEAYKTTLTTELKMSSPRILSGDKTTTFSFSFFVRFDAEPTASCVFLLYDDPVFGTFDFVYDQAGTAGKRWTWSCGVTGAGFDMSLNVFHHFYLEYDKTGGKIRFYLDNTLVDDVAIADRVDYGIDEMWVGGANFSGTEYRHECFIDHIRFFNRPLTSSERLSLLTEATVGEVFRAKRVVYGDNYEMFRIKREETNTTNTEDFKVKRVVFGENYSTFKLRRELALIEDIRIFRVRRLCTTDLNVQYFKLKREVDMLHLRSFKLRREVASLHQTVFVIRRAVHDGGGVVFSVRRAVQRDFKFSYFKAVRALETVATAVIIERTNV